MMNKTTTDARHWLLSIIGAVPWVEGATRLQKYAFLVAQRIKDIPFYEDWIASDYGPFSPKLADDLDLLLKEGSVNKFKVKNEFDYWVDRFALTDKGNKIHDDFVKENRHMIDKIKGIIVYYHGKSLTTLLADVYRLYPNYSSSSKIRPDVGKRIYESDTYLNPEFDEETP